MRAGISPFLFENHGKTAHISVGEERKISNETEKWETGNSKVRMTWVVWPVGTALAVTAYNKNHELF